MHNYYGKNEELVVVENEYGIRSYRELNEQAEKIIEQENKVEELERQRDFLLKFLKKNPSIEQRKKQKKKNIVIKLFGTFLSGALITGFVTFFSPILSSYEGFKWFYIIMALLTTSFGAFMAKEEIEDCKSYIEEILGKKAKVYYLDEQIKKEYEKQEELGELKSVVPPKEPILEPTCKINNERMIGQIRKNLEEWRRFFLNRRGTKETYQIYTEFQEEVLIRERIKNKVGCNE